MTEVRFEFEGNSRDPNSFSDHGFKVVAKEDGWTTITMTKEGEFWGLVDIPNFLLAHIAWMYLDRHFKSRLLMSGLTSFWDVITVAENRQRFKIYQMTERGFKRIYAKFIKDGIL